MSISTKKFSNPQSKEIAWQALLMATFDSALNFIW